MTAVQWIAAIGSALAVLGTVFGACWWVVRHSLHVQRFALEAIADMKTRIAALELQAIDGKELDAALEKALAKLMNQIERRLDGMEQGLRSATSEMHQVRVDLAVLKDREGGVDYSEHNRRMMGASRNG